MGARRSKKTKGSAKHTRTVFPAIVRLQSTFDHEQHKAASGRLPNNTSNTDCTASNKEAETESTSNSKVTEQALGRRASQEVESGSSLVTTSKTN